MAGLLLWLLALGAGPEALAYVIEPPGLRERSVTYFNDAGQHEWAVSRAVRAWNWSGADVRLSPGSRERAELVFAYMPGHSTLGGRTIQLDRSSLSGELGKARPGDAVTELPLLTPRDARTRRFEMALVVAHEIGHVLGLGHDDRMCAAMNSSIIDGAPSGCTPPPPGTWRCRLVEEDDARGVVELYGGRPGPIRSAPFCPKARPPSRPAELTARLGRAGRGAVVVHGRLASESADGTKVVIAHDRGQCPASPAAAEASTTAAIRAGRFRVVFPHGLSRSTCYAAWSQDRFDRLSSGTTTAWFHPPPPPPPPMDVVLSASPGDSPGGFGAGLGWRNPQGGGVATVLLDWDPQRCRTRPAGGGGSSRSLRPSRGVQRYRDLRLFVTPPESGCYMLWSSDRYGRRSEVVQVPIDGSGTGVAGSSRPLFTALPSGSG